MTRACTPELRFLPGHCALCPPFKWAGFPAELMTFFVIAIGMGRRVLAHLLAVDVEMQMDSCEPSNPDRHARWLLSLTHFLELDRKLDRERGPSEGDKSRLVKERGSTTRVSKEIFRLPLVRWRVARVWLVWASWRLPSTSLEAPMVSVAHSTTIDSFGWCKSGREAWTNLSSSSRFNLASKFCLPSRSQLEPSSKLNL